MNKFITLIIAVSILASCKKDTPTTNNTILTLTTKQVSSITPTSAFSGGFISTNESISSWGVCWSTTNNPTIEDNKTIQRVVDTMFTSAITELTPRTTYYVRAYAINRTGTIYGNVITFTTADNPSAVIPTLTTTAISTITNTSATSGGNISDDGGATVTIRGVCWGTTSNPTVANSNTTDGSGTGIFTSSLTGLIPNTTYYLRAYASNSAGIAYGNQLTFTTTNVAATLASLTTTSISTITNTSANSGGNITTDGGALVTVRGVCWNTSPNPTTSNNKTTNGTGVGQFTSNLTSLSLNTTYYVRAYATNSVGTAYGNQVTFTTTNNTIPTLTTTAISGITNTAAASGGNISSDGGIAVTARGVCWSTSPNPTTANSKTTNGTGTGTYTSSLASLTPNTTYYVRAYATNGLGTAYGNQVTFTTTNTIVVIPTLTTAAISNISTTTSNGGGNISSDGGGAITVRGVCWNTATNPTTTNSKTTDGTGIGAFNSSLTGLTANTTYYVRAYATNSAGTAYGNEVTFTTTASSVGCGSTTTVTDIDGNVYNVVQIGNQCWMKQNLKTSKYRNGDAIPNITNASSWIGLTSGAYSYYNNNSANNSTYGKLYNGFAVSDPRNICPNGWHIPTKSEWDELVNFLGGESVAGGAMKTTTLWDTPNTGATNSSGFSSFPGGFRGDYLYSGAFLLLGSGSNYWSSTGSSNELIEFYLFYSNTSIINQYILKENGDACRCIKD